MPFGFIDRKYCSIYKRSIKCENKNNSLTNIFPDTGGLDQPF